MIFIIRVGVLFTISFLLTLNQFCFLVSNKYNRIQNCFKCHNNLITYLNFNTQQCFRKPIKPKVYKSKWNYIKMLVTSIPDVEVL